jgi:Mn-dependent DtxR family transcriptional regulator
MEKMKYTREYIEERKKEATMIAHENKNALARKELAGIIGVDPSTVSRALAKIDGYKKKGDKRQARHTIPLEAAHDVIERHYT